MVSPPTVKEAVDTDPVTVRFVEKLPAPTTSKATVGAVVPIPNRLENDAVPEVKICWLLPKVIVVSVPPEASNVQVIPLPDPNVVDPTSVVSRLISKVPLPLSEVSTPLVPPEIVLVAPKAVVELPLSPANVMVELSSSAFEIDVPNVEDKVLLVT